MVAPTPSSHTPASTEPPFVPTVTRPRPRLFGQWLVDRGVITRVDLREALALMRAVNSTIGELAVAHGLVTSAQAEEINELQRHVDGRWGDIAIALGVGRATAARIEQLVWDQQVENLRLSDALVELGFVTATAIDDLLAQFDDEKDDSPVLDSPTRARLEALTEGLPRLLRRVLGDAVRMSAPRPADDDAYECSAQFTLQGDAPCTIGMSVDRRVAKALGEALHVDMGSAVSPRLDTAVGAFLVLFGAHLARRLDAPLTGSFRAMPPVAGSLPEGRWAVDIALASGKCVVLIDG
jgi:hypothetical protein